MVISNSSPLIHLTRLGKISYLFKLVKHINIPKAVFDEVVVKGKLKNYSEAFTIERFVKEEKIIVIIKVKNFIYLIKKQAENTKRLLPIINLI